MKISKISVLLAFVFAMCFSLFSAPAHAQATRTWVSGVGDDANPCSRTAPCKTFAGAISKTAAGGEINCLDPGGFGAVTITKAITISAPITSRRRAGVRNQRHRRGGRRDRQGRARRARHRGVRDGAKWRQRYLWTRGLYHPLHDPEFHANGVNMASSTSGGHAFINDSFILFNAGGVNAQGTANFASITNTQILSNTSFAVQANGPKTSLASRLAYSTTARRASAC